MESLVKECLSVFPPKGGRISEKMAGFCSYPSPCLQNLQVLSLNPMKIMRTLRKPWRVALVDKKLSRGLKVVVQDQRAHLNQALDIYL